MGFLRVVYAQTFVSPQLHAEAERPQTVNTSNMPEKAVRTPGGIRHYAFGSFRDCADETCADDDGVTDAIHTGEFWRHRVRRQLPTESWTRGFRWCVKQWSRCELGRRGLRLLRLLRLLRPQRLQPPSSLRIAHC